MIAELFDVDGPLAEVLPRFAPRREQRELAEAVQRIVDSGGYLIGEAGTGVGKTFAYLVPAVLSGQRVIVSTGTRHLQDQLFGDDLPRVYRALGLPMRAALLKGRANYLCRHRLERAVANPAWLQAEERRQLGLILAWSRETTTGDRAEVRDVPEDALIWQQVVSNEEFCSQHDPADLEDCFVYRARRRAQEADLVVVNHHLLCADLALRDTGFGDLLPSADLCIVDEAHQLPEVAARFFGRRLSSRQFLDLARDVSTEQMREAPDTPELRAVAEGLEIATRHFRLAFDTTPTRAAWATVADRASMQAAQDDLVDALNHLVAALAASAKRGKGLEGCHRRVEQQREDLRRFVEPENDVDHVHWFETWRNGFGLARTPLTVADPFGRTHASLADSWVFTSATLAVGERFDHFAERLGLDDFDAVRLDSPFDYARNARLFLPARLPEPASPDYTRAAMAAVLPLLEAGAGRAFLLFTSYRALDEAAGWLAMHTELPLLRQGERPKHQLLERFVELGNAILLGTASFWEGVDVRGTALACVVIDRIPFGSPGDPVLAARIDRLRRTGGNAFATFQLPEAAITLKQGAGRLIRDVDDTGVLVLCDPRIRSRGYGRTFVESLPPMTVTYSADEAADFLRASRPVPVAIHEA